MSFKVCSDHMTSTFTDFNGFYIYEKKIKQWSWKTEDLCQKFDIWFKNLQKLPKNWDNLEEITVLSNGVFGIRNRIFGKFFVLFTWQRLETPPIWTKFWVTQSGYSIVGVWPLGLGFWSCAHHQIFVDRSWILLSKIQNFETCYLILRNW